MGLVLIVVTGIAALFIAGYASVKWGIKSLSVFAPVCVLCVIGTSYSYDLSMMLFTSIVTGAVTGLSFKYMKSAGFVILISTVLISAVATANYYYLSSVKHIDLMKIDKAELQRTISEKVSNSVEAEMAMTAITDAFAYVEKLMPAYLFFRALVAAGIGYMILGPWILRKNRVKPIKGFEFFKLNEHVIFILIAAIAATVFTLKKGNAFHWFSMNVLLVFGSLYMMQSIGIIKHFVIKHRVPVIIIPFLLLGFLFLGKFAVVAAVLLAGIGALDVWVDFRNLSGKRQTPSDKD
jgi:hypothetical protein